MGTNLMELFEVQRKLDAEIDEKHPATNEENRLAKRVLALSVEVGELANELPEVFKFWSNKKNDYEKALKEYVDCFHFVLSIGNVFWDRLGKGLPIEKVFPNTSSWLISHMPDDFKNVEDIVSQFNGIYEAVGRLSEKTEDDYSGEYAADNYSQILCYLLGLGEMLGFTWEQIETAYMSKNATNWERQANGY